jgi:hypothetical protein
MRPQESRFLTKEILNTRCVSLPWQTVACDSFLTAPISSATNKSVPLHRAIIDWLLRRDRREAIDSQSLVNLTMLALVQMGLNVGTVLTAGAVLKWYGMLDSMGVPIRSIQIESMLCDYGWMAMALPPIWLGLTLSKRRDPDTTDELNFAMVMTGWGIIAGWLLIFFNIVLFPWLNKLSGCCSLSID